MSAPAGEQGSRSPVEAILRWCRDWKRAAGGMELPCIGEEVDRTAKDVGVSAFDLRTIARQRPAATDLLLRRMTALDVDADVVSRTEGRTFRDLQRVCTLCQSRRRCAQDLVRDSADPDWKDYCLNAATLTALSVLPWAAR